jgi:hypothetical protein
MASIYRNWHTPANWFRAKKKNLSEAWAPTAERIGHTLTEIRFTEEYGQQITFILDEQDAMRLLVQLQKRFEVPTK